LWQRLDAWLDTLSPRVVAFLFALPFFYGCLHKLLHPGLGFSKLFAAVDFGAVACAGNTFLHHQPLYAGVTGCPFTHATVFVYTPLAAQFFGTLQNLFGPRGEKLLYAMAYVTSLYLVLRPLLRADAELVQRAPFLVGISATATLSGNLSVLLHATIFLVARRFGQRPALLLVPIVLFSMIKPTFCVYLVLFLFLDRQIWQRVAFAAVGAVLIGTYFVQFRLHDPEQFSAWISIAKLAGLRFAEDHSFLDLSKLAGVTNLAWTGALYVLFVALISACGMVVAETCIKPLEQRLIFGIAVCLLLYPRLMDYDQFTLPLGLGILSATLIRTGSFTSAQLRRITYCIGLVCCLLGGHLGGRVLFVCCCLLLMRTAAAAWRTQRALSKQVTIPALVGSQYSEG
jgi:hypothetical protein